MNVFLSTGAIFRGMRHQQLAETILLSPALQRLHTVFRQDRLPVMPSEAVAQRERVLHAVRRHTRPIDHLRSNLRVLVRAEEGVVDEIAVVARDVGGRPDRIEDLQIGLRHEAKGLPALLGPDRRCTERTSGGRSCASDDLSPTNAKRIRDHLFTLVSGEPIMERGAAGASAATSHGIGHPKSMMTSRRRMITPSLWTRHRIG